MGTIAQKLQEVVRVPVEVLAWRVRAEAVAAPVDGEQAVAVLA